MDDQSDAAKRTLVSLGYTWDGEYWHPPAAMPPPPDDPAARNVAVMLIVRTTDAAIFPENFNLSGLRASKALRRAVIANLPKVTRVIAVMDEDSARLMFTAHSIAAQASGLGTILRPPSDYRAPHDPKPPLYP